jgi:hypothetical protein
MSDSRPPTDEEVRHPTEAPANEALDEELSAPGTTAEDVRDTEAPPAGTAESLEETEGPSAPEVRHRSPGDHDS